MDVPKLNTRAVDVPKRVLHVIQRMRPGGVQTAVMNLYRHIDRSQVQFDFAVRSHQPEYYDEEIRDLGGRLFQLPWKNRNPISLIAYKQALAAVLHESGPFIALHSHAGLYSGHILPIARQANIPLRLAHSHSAASDKPSVLRNIWANYMRRSIRHNATHILACSSLAAHWLYGPGWSEDVRVTKFPNAIELERYAILDNDKVKWRQMVGLPVKGLLVGHIGRFDHVKNHAFLLELFSAFHFTYPDSRLVLIGEGPLKQQIEQQVVTKGIKDAVIFMGVRDDVPQILGALDLFVLPSLHEGFGIVLVEAQAASVPCLASDAVSVEVDLGLELVQFESLDAGIDTWLWQLRALSTVPPIQWEKRKATIQKLGFDVQNSAMRLLSLYLTKHESRL